MHRARLDIHGLVAGMQAMVCPEMLESDPVCLLGIFLRRWVARIIEVCPLLLAKLGFSVLWDPVTLVSRKLY